MSLSETDFVDTKRSNHRVTQCLFCAAPLGKVSVAKKIFICEDCRRTLREKFEYNTPSNRVISPTVGEAYLNLLEAVRRQAQEDQKEDDWVEYWIKESGLAQAFEETAERIGVVHGVHSLNSYSKIG